MLQQKRGGFLACVMMTAVFLLGAPLYGDDSQPILDPGVYELHNHPDGNAAPPLYGLRTDELIDVTPNHDIFTYDFDAPGSSMFLELTPTTARIYGTVFGGLNQGTGYDPTLSGYWSVDFTYVDLVSLVPVDNDYTDQTSNDSGTLTQLFGAGTTFELGSYKGFYLGDRADDLGHRGFAGISGWGWLTYASGHENATDWLFTVGDQVAVPEPGTYLSLGALLSMALWASSRRKSVKVHH